MIYTMLPGQSRPTCVPDALPSSRGVIPRRDVYGWVITPEAPTEAGQTVQLCGVADVRMSTDRAMWRMIRTGSPMEAAQQLLWMRNEQCASVIGEFQDNGLHIRSFCTRRGEGPDTYIPGAGDTRLRLQSGAWISAAPASNSLGIAPYGEPCVILIDRRGDYDSFTLGTRSGTLEHGWFQMGLRPSRLALIISPRVRGTITSAVTWQAQTLSEGRARWLVDQAGDAVPDLSYFLREKPEWWQA